MCSPVIYAYSCGHREQVVYRCGTPPAGATQEQINTCVQRELRVRGHWTTTLGEPCHFCEQLMRVHRRDSRRRARVRPGFLDSTPSDPQPIFGNMHGTETALLAEDSAARESMSTPAEGTRSRLSLENQEQNRRHGPDRSDHDFRTNDSPWMAHVAQPSPEGVIRPLETSRLANIGRLDLGLPSELTPTQIWRFFH